MTFISSLCFRICTTCLRLLEFRLIEVFFKEEKLNIYLELHIDTYLSLFAELDSKTPCEN